VRRGRWYSASRPAWRSFLLAGRARASSPLARAVSLCGGMASARFPPFYREYQGAVKGMLEDCGGGGVSVGSREPRGWFEASVRVQWERLGGLPRRLEGVRRGTPAQPLRPQVVWCRSGCQALLVGQPAVLPRCLLVRVAERTTLEAEGPIYCSSGGSP